MKHLLFAALLGSTAMIPVAASAQQAQPQGQPQQQQAQQAQQGQQQGQQGQLQELAVSDLMDRQIVTQQGETIGTVAGVVQREDDRFVVIEMQQGQARMLLPLDRVNMQGEQLVAQVQQGRVMGAQEFGEQQQAQVEQVEEREMVQVRMQVEGQTAQQQQAQMRDPTGALISVDQQPAQVRVQQQPPQIIVRQSPPNIIVQQSQPEIIVRMPEPQVAVSQAEPRVQVEQAQPRVRTDGAQAMVSTEQAQPRVTFERTGEPQIQFQEEAGQPRIRIERMAQGEQQGQQQMQQAQQRDSREFFGVGQEPQATGAVGTPQQQNIAVTDIAGREIYNYQGEELGTVERIIQDPQSQQFFVVVSHGGFLGLGDDEVIMPLERVVLQDDELMVQGVTEEDLEAMADADRYTRYPEATGDVVISRTN